ncbi:diaminopimelate decarboxylase [Erysipelothrix urinaevulpis]|uniref:diaminopimelate decarboxylase n=1 Tax=Erysipelothrix urinaevulpis TaxID=2683717 RepID=UPI00135C9D00|nr:diaminopimelate decarboxylase [Erysipelothrix urinaevulpis]
MKLRGTMTTQVNDLLIGGVALKTLKKEYGTPLFIVDEEALETTAKTFINQFQSNQFETIVAYASKALLNMPLAQLLDEQGLHFDVASMGEIYVLKRAGINLEHCYFHGNNKTSQELEYAVRSGVGVIVIDNYDELDRLSKVLETKEIKQTVLFRINVGIETDTHRYIQTSTNTSKFGESIHDERIMMFIQELIDHPKLDFRGFHSHIGSQIFDKKSFYAACDAVLNFQAKVEKELKTSLTWVNLGGGFGVYYSEGDSPFAMASFLKEYIDVIEDAMQKYHLKLERVIIEPGRSIINDVVSTLYTVGGSKYTIGGKNYVFVDGGMSENIRPALYEAVYETWTSSASKQLEHYTVAGKLCESGDVLIETAQLPQVQPDDLLLIPASGAYTYSMSSNYNKILKPAIVGVKNKQSRVMVKRETLEDLVRLDVIR